MEAKKILKNAVFAGALAATAMGGNAYAVTSSLDIAPGVIGVTDTANFGNNGLMGAFTDNYNFTLSGAPSFNLAAQVQPLNFVATSPFGQAMTISQITGLSMTLLKSGSGAIASGNTISSSNLLGGNYSLQVSGTGSGMAGGIYNGVAWVQPVPELSTWAMMAVGVGLMGMALRRRSRTEQDEKFTGVAA